MADLTMNNFVSKIKEMNERERKRISLSELINIILQLPCDFESGTNVESFHEKFAELNAAIDFVKTQAINNTTEILILKNVNNDIRTENIALKEENITIKADLITCEEKLDEHENHLNGIEQYLRINNLEIVGLPVADPVDTPIEDELLKIFNSIPELPKAITSDDIDICHILPTNRNDQKLVAVCRFVSRKTKYEILEAKKKCRQFKYRDNAIYINDHLSPSNRKLFALASQKKKDLRYKFLWTKNNSIFLRENERSPIIIVNNEKSLENLRSNLNNVDDNYSPFSNGDE